MKHNLGFTHIHFSKTGEGICIYHNYNAKIPGLVFYHLQHHRPNHHANGSKYNCGCDIAKWLERKNEAD